MSGFDLSFGSAVVKIYSFTTLLCERGWKHVAKHVPGISGNLVVKSKPPPQCDCSLETVESCS